MSLFDGKTAIITGSTGGTGPAIAAEFAKASITGAPTYNHDGWTTK
jgi:NAD(P)-dependent dehydrogenase (short-subunit alcohol dehydrogenase family)